MFKSAKKKDVEGSLDAFAALGVLTAFDTAAGSGGGRWERWGEPLMSRRARAIENGVTPKELVELITRLAFYAG